MKLQHLLQGIQVMKQAAASVEDVSTVCYAAGQCEKDSLFVAIAGLQHDGHDFIAEAIARGARFIVHEKDFTPPVNIAAILVPDSRRALGILAGNYFNHPSSRLVLIAITGTSGKTTITYLLESILKAAGYQCGVLGTVNYRYNDKSYPAPNTTPESFELQKILRMMADDGVTHVVAEVSSHAVELKRVDDCDFDLGIFTNLTPEHLDYHQTMESYFQAKRRFFAEVLPQSRKKYAQKMVINADDPWGQRILNEVKLPALAYGMSESCAIRSVSYELSLAGISAEIDFNGETISLASSLIGKFNLYNILAAIGAAAILKISPVLIKAGIDSLSCVPGRLEKIETSFGAYVFVDYAHKSDALTQVLQNLTQLKQRRIITVFGCGGNRDRGKRPLMGDVATSYSDLTVVTSDNPRLEEPLAIIAEIEAGIDQNKIKKMSPNQLVWCDQGHGYTVIPDRKKAIETAVGMAQEGDIILIAGKGHEDYQIVGKTKLSFDDRVVAMEALKLRQ